VTRDTMFTALSGAMATRITQWSAGDRFDTIRADWMARAAGIGQPIRVRTGMRELDGRFETIDAMGGLVLALPNGAREVISAGEVSLGQPLPYEAAQ
jgi:BirA family transcriptional regulator, biotin operon repressor / biotin---[acetyl-CoA-carboxylase] ligase